MENNGGESFLRQLSVGSSPPPYYNSSFTKTTSSSSSSSKRWGTKKKKKKSRRRRSTQMEEEEEEGCGVNGMSVKKRVMVVIDQSTRAKHAMMWALTHMVNRGDILTLLHVVPPPLSPSTHKEKHGPNLAHSLGSLCKACKPEVEVEALVIQGPKLATVLGQVKKLEASVLVLGQSKPSLFSCLFRSSAEDFVEQCIKRAQCLTMAVRKQSKGVGGYLVSTRWQKNFWLLA